MKKYFICGFLFAAAVVSWERGDPVRAQADANPTTRDSKKDAADKPPVTIDRIYDVRNLVRPIKDYPMTGGPLSLTRLGEPAPNTAQPAQANGPFPQPLPLDRPEQEAAEMTNRANALQKLITDRVDEISWQNVGGSASITWYDGQFLITQTVENQLAIQKLLRELRTARSGVVRVRADWVLLSAAQLEKLQDNGDDHSAVPEIAQDQLRALPDSTLHYSGSIVCFSGQTVSIASGRAKSLVTNLIPVPAYAATDFVPSAVYIQEGLSLQVTPTVIGDSARLDLASIITEPNRFVPHPTTQPSLDRVDSDLQHFHTTVEVPLNKPVLIAGATADPNPQEPAGMQLYLIVEADSSK